MNQLGKTIAIGAGGAAVAVVLVVGIAHLPHPKHGKLAKIEHHPAGKVDLPNYIETHESSPDPVVQDKVGEARMHLAYAQADQSFKDPKNAQLKSQSYDQARQTFLAAAKTKGQGAADPNYGTISEQAAYQAAVCLVAENKPEQAKQEFATFMKERPLSPLCKACYDRINRIEGRHTDEADALYQSDLKAQEKHVAFETSVCGPKAIAALLPLIHKPIKKYQEVAKLCGTTDKGTTIEGMRKGLKALGVESFGFQLNAPDFNHLQTPAILLSGDHYLIVKSISAGKAQLFDPTANSTRDLPLPKPDDAEFSANVISLTVPKMGDK